jgi:ribosomal protein S7
LFSFIFSQHSLWLCWPTQTAEADLKKLADAVAELEPALEVFIAKYGALDKVPVDLAQQFLRRLGVL